MGVLLEKIKFQIKKLDKYKKPELKEEEDDGTTATVLGGILTALIPVIVAVLLVSYATTSIGGGCTTATTTVMMTNVFSGDQGDKNVYFPRMKCIVDGGCYYVPSAVYNEDTGSSANDNGASSNEDTGSSANDNGASSNDNTAGNVCSDASDCSVGTAGTSCCCMTASTCSDAGDCSDCSRRRLSASRRRRHRDRSRRLQASGRACYWVAEGEDIPKEHRVAQYDPDPINAFTILWGGGENFGVGYEVSTVTKSGLYSGETKVTEPGDYDTESIGYKIYKGESMFSLVKTTSVQKSDDPNYMWLHTVTSEDGTPDSDSNLCCGGGGDAYATDSTTGESVSVDVSCDDEETYELRIKPLPTFTHVEVENPFELNTILGLVGGYIASIDSIAALILLAFFTVLESKRFSGKGKNIENSEGDRAKIQDQATVDTEIELRKVESEQANA